MSKGRMEIYSTYQRNAGKIVIVKLSQSRAPITHITFKFPYVYRT